MQLTPATRPAPPPPHACLQVPQMQSVAQLADCSATPPPPGAFGTPGPARGKSGGRITPPDDLAGNPFLDQDQGLGLGTPGSGVMSAGPGSAGGSAGRRMSRIPQPQF
jgi:hypothetical protein